VRDDGGFEGERRKGIADHFGFRVSETLAMLGRIQV
jgi:hypothetical protein